MSRVLGFARDVLFAQALGAGPVADAFLAAFRLPNLVRRITGEGGLNPALVPVLSRLRPEEAAKVSGDVLAVFALALLALAGLVEVGAGFIAFLLAPGLRDEGTLALVALYTRLGFPMVLGVTLSSIGAALLNLRGHYRVTAVAPLVVNGGLIATALALEAGSARPLAEKAAWLAAATSASGLGQLAIVAAAVLRAGDLVAFRRPRWSPFLRSLLLAGIPAIVASGAVQLAIRLNEEQKKKKKKKKKKNRHQLLVNRRARGFSRALTAWANRTCAQLSGRCQRRERRTPTHSTRACW